MELLAHCSLYTYVYHMTIWHYNDLFPVQVSTQLYTAREKQQLADLVDTMISYGLTYKQERGSDGQYTYMLDPWVIDS